MNVITKNSPTGITSHCTARCYNSTRKKCTCICKGLLHGKGEAYAKREAPMAAMYLQMRNGDGSKYYPAVDLVQDRTG